MEIKWQHQKFVQSHLQVHVYRQTITNQIYLDNTNNTLDLIVSISIISIIILYSSHNKRCDKMPKREQLY